MKLKTSLFVLTLTASTALAQSVMTPINKARDAARASSARTEQSNAVLNQQHAAPATSSSAPAKPTPFVPKLPAKAAPPAPAKAGAAAPATMPAGATPEKAETTAKVVQPEMKRPPKDARDPFVSIIRTDKTGAVPCVSGKKCLVIGEIVFRGIIKSSNTTIAVVENPEKKTYFLHENDPVFNGNVVKITGDSIVFREQVIDRAGRKSSREITKHVNPRPIA